MMIAWLIGGALLAASPPANESATRADYEARKALAGRDAEAHVKLALWCESKGMAAERLKHLAIAVMVDPKHAAARGLLGMVADGGSWRKPEDVSDRIAADEKMHEALADYNRKRQFTPETADAQFALALWCEKNGLKPEATAHLSTVVRLDPSREAAWKKLGCRKHKGKWLNEGQIAAEIAENQAKATSDKRWHRELETLRTKLGREESKTEAEATLADVRDPRAVTAIRRVFAIRGPEDQKRAVGLLERITSSESAKLLAEMAVFAKTPAIRAVATEAVARQDPRDTVGPLIAMMKEPLKVHVEPVLGPGKPGSLTVEGEQASLRRVYAPPPAPKVTPKPGDIVGHDHDGLAVINRAAGTTEVSFQDVLNRRIRHTYTIEKREEIPVGRMMKEANRSAYVAQQQLEEDALAVERANAPAYEVNGRIAAVLNRITGQNLGDESPDQWQAWWTDQQGYAYAQDARIKPTMMVSVPLAYLPQSTSRMVNGGVVGYRQSYHHACFAAGTPVRTLSGLKPIESLKVGDRVLTQDTTTGSLGYEPILRVFHNPPNATLTVRLADDSVVCTGIHRFWKPGQGWSMARDLKPGDLVRVAGGTSRVESVEPAEVQLVFNLEVAGAGDFFVGKRGALVHDNSVVQPVSHPFDAVGKTDLAAR